MSDETKVVEKKCGHNCHLCGHEWLGRCNMNFRNDVSVEDTPICPNYWYAGSVERLKEIEADIKEFNLNGELHVLSLDKTHLLHYVVKDDTQYDITLYTQISDKFYGSVNINYIITERGQIKAAGNISQDKRYISKIAISCEWITLTVFPNLDRQRKELIALKVFCTDHYNNKSE